MHTCQIQWITAQGKPTPDTNPAIGRVRCKRYRYSLGHRQPWVAGEYSAWFNICADHARQLAYPDMCEWEIERFECVRSDDGYLPDEVLA